MSIFIGTRVPNTTGGASESFRQTGHHTYATSGDGVGYKLAFDQKIRYISAGVPVVVTMSAATPAYVWQGSFGSSDSTAKKDWNPVESKWVAFCALSGGQIYLAHEVDIPDIGAANDIVATDLIHHFDGWHQYQPKIPVVVTPDSSILVLEGGLAATDLPLQVDASFPDSFTSLGLFHSGPGLSYVWPIDGQDAHNYGVPTLSQNRIASDNAGHCMLINTYGRLLYGAANQTPDTYTDITDTTYNSTSTDIHDTYERKTCCGVNCDGTTWWALICQAVSATDLNNATVFFSGSISDWRMDVYSSEDATTWTHRRTINHGWPTDSTAFGIGEAGQILVMSGIQTGGYISTSSLPADTFSYAVGTGTAALIPLDTTSTDFRHRLGYNLFLVMIDSFHEHSYYFVMSSNVSVYAPIRFCSGPNGPIWFGGPNLPEDLIFALPGSDLDSELQVQTLVDMTGAWDDHPLCLAMDDGAGGLYGVDDTTGDFIHRPGPAGTAWVVLIPALHPANEECVFLQYSRKYPGQIVVVHGLGGVAKTTYIDATSFSVLSTSNFSLALVDVAFGFGGTSGSQLYTTFTCLTEPAP